MTPDSLLLELAFRAPSKSPSDDQLIPVIWPPVTVAGCRMLPFNVADSAMRSRATFESLFTNWLIYYRDVTYIRETCDMGHRPLPADANYVFISAAKSAHKEFMRKMVRTQPGRRPNPLCSNVGQASTL